MQKKVGRKKKENFARGAFRTPAQERQATAGCSPVVACSLIDYGQLPTTPLFCNFLINFFFFGCCEEVWGLTLYFGRMGV
jgi:hypothetical protein